MTMFTLQQVGDYVRRGRMPTVLTGMLKCVRKIASFPQERFNRYKRFIAIVRAYRNEISVADIEREFGCCKGTVLRYARLARLPKRPKGFEAAIRATVIALYREGKPIAQIQAQLGVSQAYISKTATEEGINRYKKRR